MDARPRGRPSVSGDSTPTRPGGPAVDPAAAAATARVFGDWTLGVYLGSGGIADVWEARRAGDGRVAAIKVLRDTRSRGLVRRFLREGRLLARLDHPGLPRCFAVGEDPQPWIAMERLEGETLGERIRAGGPLRPELVQGVARSLLRVLEHLHHHGIVHRDIKPSNCFLAVDRRILLLDLGLAADPEDPLTTTLGDVMGTYAYMAPEQISGGDVDHRADLYSLGVSLYEAATGHRPFDADGPAGFLRAHREGRAEPLARARPDLPAAVVETIERLMARDPLARPASAAIARARVSGGSTPVNSLRPPSLIGRAAALGAIEAVLDAGGSLALHGEIGSGAARVIVAAGLQARQRGVEALAVRCRARAHPLDPLEQLDRELERLVGDAVRHADDRARAVDLLCGEGGVLLLVENADEADPEARAALRELAARVPRAAMVWTSRASVTELSHTVALRPLSLEEVQKLVAGMLGVAVPPGGLGLELHRLSGGLPAIVVMAVRELVGRGALRNEGMATDGAPRWVLDRSAPLEPTVGLARLFGTALDRLDPGHRTLLEALAVVGEPIPAEDALAVAGLPPDGLELGPLQRDGLLSTASHHDGDWLQLKRPALGNLLLANLPDAARRSIHRAYAARLEARPADPWRDRHLAWHAAHGAPEIDAGPRLRALAESLLRDGQPRRALDALDRAVRSPVSAAEAAHIAVARGEALLDLGRREDAGTALQAARAIADDLDGEASLRARALLGLARFHQAVGEVRRGAQLAEEAVGLLIGGESALRAEALLIAAAGRRLTAEPSAAAHLYEEARAQAEQLGDPSALARAQGGIGILLAERGAVEEARAHLEDEAAVYRGRGDPERLVPALYRLAVLHRRAGRVDRALEALDEADEAARFAALPYQRSLVRIGRAGVHLAAGDLPGASRLLQEARPALDPDAGTFLRVAWWELQGSVRLAAGDRQAALAAWQDAETEATRAGWVGPAAYLRGMVGVLCADGAAIEAAVQVLERGGDRRFIARLLHLGATVGGDANVLAQSEGEARACGDAFLLLDVLFASAGPDRRAEAARLVAAIHAHLPRTLRPAFAERAAVRWAGLGPA